MIKKKKKRERVNTTKLWVSLRVHVLDSTRNNIFLVISPTKMEKEKRIHLLYLKAMGCVVVNNCFQTKSGLWVCDKLEIFHEWWAKGPQKISFWWKNVISFLCNLYMLSVLRKHFSVDAVFFFSLHVSVRNCFIIESVTFSFRSW